MRPDDVHVWSLHLDLCAAVRDRLEPFLSADERARAQRFARQVDQSRYVCAHGLLRLILARYLGTPPQNLAFDTDPGGKPRLRDHRYPRFNLTHADALGLVAVSAVREVGIDIERICEVGDVGRLARSCFSNAEQAELAALTGPLRLPAFFSGWTRKEAFLKAVGAGLNRPLASFDVTLAPGGPARLLRVQDEPAASYALQALRPAPGYVGAVAAEGKAILVRWRPWQTLAGLVGGSERAGRGGSRGFAERGRGRADGGGRRGDLVRHGVEYSHAVPIGEREP